MDSGSLAGILLKIAAFVATLVPMAILCTTMVCFMAVVYALFEYLYRRRVRTDGAARYRPGVAALFLTLLGAAAVTICAILWFQSLYVAPPAFEISGTQFTLPALYLMASAIVFDIGAVLLLCSEVRDAPPSQTTA